MSTKRGAEAFFLIALLNVGVVFSQWNQAGLLPDTPLTADTLINVDAFLGSDNQKVQAALARAKLCSAVGKISIIKFAGRQYDLTSPILIYQPYNGIILQGVGSDSTVLKFTFGNTDSTCIKIGQEADTQITTLNSDVNYNSHTISANNLAELSAGDWFRLSSYNTTVTDSYANGSVGQISRLESKNSNNGTMLDIASKYPKYYASDDLRIYKTVPIQSIGIENLEIWRNDSGYSSENSGGFCGNNVNLVNAVNCWIKGVYLYQTCRSHILIYKCAHQEVSGCYLHDARHHGEEGGGYAYGVALGFSSCNCLIENNIFHKLRHAMLVQTGANMNVFSFNYSYEQYWEWNGYWVPICGIDIISDITGYPAYCGGDLCLHGNWPFSNLFEHNWSCNIIADGYHGPNGTNNWFLRDMTYDDSRDEEHIISLHDAPDFQVGACMCTQDRASYVYATGDKGTAWADWFGYWEASQTMYAHTLFYLGTHDASDGYINQTSLFYASRPDFLSLTYSWPAIGPKLSRYDNFSSISQNIPARDRFNSLNKTYLPDPTSKPFTATGTIPYTQTWSANHIVTGNITVPSGLTLTIKSGVTVTFSGSSYITVQPGGTIIAESGVVFSPSDRSVRYRGAMSTDNSWGFPVLVDSTLTVGSGKWLTILPGTTVRVNSGHKIKVDGKLTANGSSGLPITFTSASGTWAGIDLYCADASSMSYCTVQNASTGVRAYQTDLTLDHCTFSSNSYSAVTFENQASGTITYSIFSGNATYAIRCLQYSNPVIRPVNRIWNNYGTAVSGDGSSLPDLGSYYNYGNNSIKNNYPDDVWSDNVNTVYAQHNYWGSSSPEPYVSDNVEWEPYLSSDPTGSLGKALAGQEVAAILHEKPSADTTGKQLFGKAYQAWIEGDTDAAGTQFEQLAQECPSSPAGLQALSMAVRCYDRKKDSAGGDAYLETVIKEKSTSVVSELAMSIKIGRLTRSAKYDEAVVAAQQLLNSATDGTLRKYALYDLATLLYHFLNDKQNGEKYYRQLLAEYPDDPLAEVAASALGQTIDEQVNEKLAKASTLPTEYGLSQNYPNPFNPQTTIQFALPEAAQVRIEVMNVLGQRIAVLSDQAMVAGFHMVRWDGRTTSGEKASSGVYFCRMQAGSFVRTIKMMLLP